MTRAIVHPESQRVHALYVGGLHRADPIVIEAAFVVSVDPWQRLLIVEQPDEELHSSEVATVVKARPAVAARTAPIAWHRAVPVGVAAAQGVGAVTRSAVPPARRFSVWLGKRVAYAAAFLVWLYGAMVYFVTRVVARVLLVSLALLSGGLRWVGPRLWSSARKLAGHARELSARNSLPGR
ncbi:MAG TPA: hypothetical protein VHS03_06720 [Gaiellaceae bacterium]|nr:hypothetical protein [Gaiellaceae bacterium]